MTDALELMSVSRVYGAEPMVVALEDVSLTIGQGEFVALEGESGSGKSTLLNVLGLLDEPTSGEFVVNGRTRADRKPRTLPLARSDSFAYIFQAFHILERRPVVESVELPMLYRGVPPEDRRRRALAALGEVGIADLAHSRGRTLSGGQRQRVAVARALAAQAPILLADEPTGNLDSENTEAVMECLKRVHQTGATVILVTHSEDLASRVGRRIRMRDGHVASDSGHPVMPDVSAPRPAGAAGRVRLADMISDAWSNVVSRIGRTIGLTSAIAVSIALAVATTGLAFSAQAQVTDTFNAAESTDVAVQWNELTADTGDAASVVSHLRSLNGVNAAALVEHHDAHPVSASPTRRALMVPTLTVVGALEAARLDVTWADDAVAALARGEALIGSTLAAQLELAPLVASPVIDVDGVPLAVIGVVTSSPRMPEWMGGVVTGPGSTGFTDTTISVTALVSTAAGAARQVSREAPLAINPYDPDQLDVQKPADPNSLRATIEGSVQASLVVLTIVALLGSVASVTLATLAAVAERRGEIGLRRALGARRRHIWMMLTLEATALGITGGIAGLMIGLGSVLAVTIARQWTPIFDPRLALFAVGAGTAIGVVGALAGAIRALRITPSEALRPGS